MPLVSLATPRRASRWSALVLAVAGLALFQFWGNATRGYIHTHSLFYWWGAQWFDPAADASYGPLVVLCALGLFAWNLQRFSTYSQSHDKKAFGLLVGALALHAIGYATQQTRLSIAAWLLFCGGCLALGWGERGWRSACFPLFFALLAIPVGFLQPWGFYLRLGIGETVESITRVLSHPLVRNGTQLYSSDGRHEYDVAAACSGVRSLVALFALAVLLGYLRDRRWLDRLVLVALVFPFAFLGNLLRIFAIIGAGQEFDGAVAERVHAVSGFLVFAIVFALLGWTAHFLEKASERRIFRRTGRYETPAKADQLAPGRGAPSNAGVSAEGRAPSLFPLFARTALLVALIALIAGGARSLDQRPLAAKTGVRLAENGIDPVSLPEFIGTEWIGQRVDVTDLERTVLPPDTGYSRKNYVSVADRENQVFVSVVLSGRDRTSIHRPELCLVGQGWVVEGSETSTLTLRDGQSIPITLLHVRHAIWRPDHQPEVIHSLFAYCFIGAREIVPTHAGMLWDNAIGRLQNLSGERWAYLVVQTLLNSNENDARKRMEEVFAPAWAVLRG